MESLGRPPTPLGDLLCMVPLVLEMDCFGVPVVNLFWYSIKGHDTLHEWHGDTGSKETNEYVVVCDAGVSGVTLKSGDVTL